MLIGDSARSSSAVGAAARRPRFLFPPIAIFYDAKRIARRAAIAAIVIAAIYCLGAALIVENWIEFGRRMDPFTIEYLSAGVGESVAEALAILFLAWRINTGRGYISALLLTGWFIGGQLINVLTGSMHLALAVPYAFLAVVLIDGVRATLIGSRLARLPSDSDRIRAFE